MKIFIPLAFAFALAVALGLIFVPPVMLSDAYADASLSQPRQSPIIPGEYIVFLEPSFVGKNVTTSGNATYMSTSISTSSESNHTLKKEEQMTIIEADKVAEQIEPQGGNVTSIYTYAFNGFSIAGVEDVTPLIDDPAIESIQPNRVYYPQAQYLDNGLNRVDIDRAIGAGSKPDNREQRPNVDVAVIDQPVTSYHPDLNVITRINMIDGCGSKILPNGATLQCYNENGFHGTSVAGSCCAKDNLGGVVGGLPGARITSLAICSVNGGCPGDATLRAWNYLIANAGTIEIATMSVGGGGAPPASEITAGQNIINAGITFFTAAGNANVNANNDSWCGVPAFICVSALGDTNGKCGGGGPRTPTYSTGGSDVDDARAPFSSFGSAVDIMAPGTQQLSTYPGIRTDDDPSNPTYYPGGTAYIGTSEQGKYTTSWGGTSAATPIAAGIGALIKSKNPSFTPAQIKSTLQADAYPQTQSCDGFGRGGLVSGANSESSEEILYAGNY